jgi:hypothetical protein
MYYTSFIMATFKLSTDSLLSPPLLIAPLQKLNSFQEVRGKYLEDMKKSYAANPSGQQQQHQLSQSQKSPVGHRG